MAVIRKEKNMLLRLVKKGKQGSNECNHWLNTDEHSVTVHRLSNAQDLKALLRIKSGNIH